MFEERPDIYASVFHKMFLKMMRRIQVEEIFGKVLACVRFIEFQNAVRHMPTANVYNQCFQE